MEYLEAWLLLGKIEATAKINGKLISHKAASQALKSGTSSNAEAKHHT